MIHPTIDMMWSTNWVSQFFRTLSTTAVGVTNLQKKLAFHLTLAAVAVGRTTFNFLVTIYKGVAGAVNLLQTDDEGLN